MILKLYISLHIGITLLIYKTQTKAKEKFLTKKQKEHE
jgi:hypothetical protein